MDQKELNYEEAFDRLENILNQMNENQMSLDKSLSNYEEADQLIQKCQKMLKGAERKVETLIKNRDQELLVDEESSPIKEPFNIES